MKSILLKGYYGFGNFGDDLLLKVSHQILKEKYPHAKYYIYSENSPNNWQFEEESGYNNYIHKIIGEELPIVDWTFRGKVDLLFDGGGGVYNDSRKGGWKFRLINELLKAISPQQVYYLEKFVRKLKNKNKNVSFGKRIGFGLGIGPFNSSAPSFVQQFSQIGSYKVLFVRDQVSYDFLKSIQFKQPFYSFTDIVFNTSHWLPDKFKTKAFMPKEKRKVGIVLLDLQNNRYFRQLNRVAESLRALDFQVHFISFHKSYDKNFRRFFGDEVLAWDPLSMEIEGFLASLQDQDLLITARAHGAIVGACLGVPSICLKVSPKLEEVSTMLSNSSTLISPPFEPSIIVKEVVRIFNNYPWLQEKLQQDVSINKEKARKAERKLKGML